MAGRPSSRFRGRVYPGVFPSPREESSLSTNTGRERRRIVAGRLRTRAVTTTQQKRPPVDRGSSWDVGW